MDVVSFAWSRTVSLRVDALKHTRISGVPFPNYRSGVIGLAIASSLENDGHLSPWQEAVGHEIIPDTYRKVLTQFLPTGPRCLSYRRRFQRTSPVDASVCPQIVAAGFLPG
jgi:hypothetical protein